VLRTFPMDIDDYSDDDFIDFWCYLTIVHCVLLPVFMYHCLYIQHLLPNIINESINQFTALLVDRYSRSTWELYCIGVSAVSCRLNSSCTQAFIVSSSVNFYLVPATTPLPPTVYVSRLLISVSK